MTIKKKQVDCSFPIRGIRIQGNNNAGPYGECGTDPPKVYLEAVDPAIDDKNLFGNN